MADHHKNYTRVVCYPTFQIASYGIWFGHNTLYYALPRALLQLSISIVVTRLVQIMLRPFCQPSIVSDLIGGIMLGPTGLGHFPSIQLALFPDQGVFLMRTLLMVGVIWDTFATGVKTNLSVLLSGRKALLIGFAGIIFSATVSMILLLLLGDHTAHHLAGGPFWLFVAAHIGSTPMVVIHRFLSDLQLLNSEVGRLALSIGVLNDVVGILVTLLVDIIMSQPEHVDFGRTPFEIGTLLLLTLVCAFVVRPLCFWLIRRTPEGKPVDHGYVVTFMLAALNLGIWCNVIGLSAVLGPLILGLTVPSGPPLGATLVQKIQTVNRNFMLPMVFAAIGQRLNLFAVTSWTGLWAVVFIAVVGRLSKMVGTLIVALCLRIPLHQALSVGLVLVTRGLVDYLPYFMWDIHELVDPQSYAAWVMVGLVLTMVASPIVRALSKQLRIYRPFVRRTIQHSKPQSEFRLLVCIHDKENVPSIIALLQLTGAAPDNPLCVYVLHLVELLGRANPILIAHKPGDKITSESLIFNAFRAYARQLRGNVVVQPLTSVAPYKTMHHDVCSVALQKTASLIILPFQKQQLIPGAPYLVDNALQIINPNVLADAPCSVALLADRGGLGAAVAMGGDTGSRVCKVGVLFFGGPDDREALSYAGRMAQHPGVALCVMRFVAVGFGIETKEERKLDDELVSEVRLKIMGCKNVSFYEIMVHDDEEAVSALCSVHEPYDLMVVGREQRFGLELANGLSMWSENRELGVVGDFCCSPEFFGGGASVLVVQQQARVAADVDYWE